MGKHRLLPLVLLLALGPAVAPVALAERPGPVVDHLREGFRDPPKDARPAVYWLWLNGYVNREHVARELQEFHAQGIRGVLIFDMGARGAAGTIPTEGPAFMSDQSVADIEYAVRVAQRLGMDVQLSVSSSWDMGGSWVEPQHASMGLFSTETAVQGPAQFDEVLPMPPIPAGAPRDSDGQPVFRRNVAVLAFPAARRLPGHDFVFQLDPPGRHTLAHAVLYNITSDDPKKHGEAHLFAKDFSLAVSTTDSADEAFHEVLQGSLRPTVDAQKFELPAVEARFVRLRLLNGHNRAFDRIQLGEFELFNTQGINVVASHEADRTRDGAILVRHSSALGHDRNWTAANIHDGVKTGPAGGWSSAGLPSVVIEDLSSIVDLTDRLQPDGRLQWDVPAGPWVLARFECLNTGERLKVPSPQSDGLATDHLSAEATRAFLDPLISRLQSRLGNLGETALKQLYLASYEVRGPIWTPELPARFEHYRGYALRPYLPVLSGTVLVNDEVTQRFLYDYRKTLGDLLVDAYYGEAVQAAHAAGVGIESEAGGPGPPIHQVPVDALKALGAIDEVRGEFWPKRPDADSMWVVKETACAAHIYGKRRVHMEAFTSMDQWQDGPFDLKPSADRVFCEGANHFVWHTAAHLPPESGKPGWVYHAGTHLNTNIVWWPKAKPFLDYLARCSYLLQQGLFVGDVCYYYGDQGYNFVPPKHVDPSLGFGFDYDVTNREVLLERMSVRDGRIVLPDGMSYALLVLPDRPDMDWDVLRKLEQLVRDGATIVGPKPTCSNGLTDYPQRDAQVRQLADRLWGECDGHKVLEHKYGQGRVVWGRALRELLRERQIGPDFSFVSPQADSDLDFIHRQTEEADIYFVRNKRPRWEQVEATFRVRGRTPELWQPDTGLVSAQHVFRSTDNGTSLPLQLTPYGAVFVVFRSADTRPAALQFDQPGEAVGISAARVESWDGHRVTVTAYQPGRYRVTTGDGRSAEWQAAGIPPAKELRGTWEVRFPEGLGAPPATQMDELISWTEHANEGIRHFSGIADYHHVFELPADWIAAGRRVLLDLGDLWCVGDVTLNGKPFGVLWRPPYVVDVTSAAVAGRNELIVQVANTWSNRLVGDAGRPPNERFTRTNVTHTNGRRWSDVPLIRSGLFGPVRLLPAVTLSAEPQ